MVLFEWFIMIDDDFNGENGGVLRVGKELFSEERSVMVRVSIAFSGAVIIIYGKRWISWL